MCVRSVWLICCWIWLLCSAQTASGWYHRKCRHRSVPPLKPWYVRNCLGGALLSQCSTTFFHLLKAFWRTAHPKHSTVKAALPWDFSNTITKLRVDRMSGYYRKQNPEFPPGVVKSYLLHDQNVDKIHQNQRQSFPPEKHSLNKFTMCITSETVICRCKWEHWLSCHINYKQSILL